VFSASSGHISARIVHAPSEFAVAQGLNARVQAPNLPVVS